MISGNDCKVPAGEECNQPSFYGHCRIALCIVTIWLLFLSLYPFRTVSDVSEIGERLWQGVIHPFAITGMLKHVIIFVLFGMVLMLVRPVKTFRRGFLTVLVVLLVFSTVIEIGQAAIPSRHCRAGDVVLHTISGAVGAIVAGVLIQRTYVASALSKAARPVWGALFAVTVAAIIGILTLTGPYGSSLANWDPSFCLIMGDEHGGDRAWRGRLQGAAIYPSAVSPGAIRRLAAVSMDDMAGINMRRELDALVLVPLSESRDGEFRNLAIGVPDLTLVVDPAESYSSSDDVGAQLDGTRIIQAAEQTSWLVDRIKRANAFTVEVIGAPNDLTQDGPARIASLSQDVSYRNVTLGQVGTSLVVRVRTPLNGRNGSRLPGVWHDVFTNYKHQHIAVTYDGAVIRAFVNGEEREPSQSLQSISLALGVDDAVAPFAAAVLFFLPLGVCGAVLWFDRRRAWRLILASGCGLSPVIILMAITWMTLQRPIAPVSLPALALPAIVIGDCLGSYLAAGRPGEVVKRAVLFNS